jgi:hypothetical protein
MHGERSRQRQPTSCELPQPSRLLDLPEAVRSRCLLDGATITGLTRLGQAVADGLSAELSDGRADLLPVAIPRKLFADILRLIAELRPAPDPAPA